MCSLALLASTLAACAARPSEDLSRPARAIYLSSGSAERLETQFQALATQRAPAVLIISEEDFNSYLQARLTADDILQALRVWFTRDGLYVAAEFDLLGRQQFDAALQATADQGEPTVSVQQATLNGRPLSSLALKALNEAVQVALADAQLPLTVERVTFGEGRLLLWASSKSSVP